MAFRPTFSNICHDFWCLERKHVTKIGNFKEMVWCSVMSEERLINNMFLMQLPGYNNFTNHLHKFEGKFVEIKSPRFSLIFRSFFPLQISDFLLQDFVFSWQKKKKKQLNISGKFIYSVNFTWYFSIHFYS